MFQVAFCLLLALPPAAESTDLTARLSPIPEAGMRRFGIVDPQGAMLSGEKPSSVTKAPERPELLWATFQFGPTGASISITIALDESNPAAPAIWIDANANGDLTDDPQQTWSEVASTDSASTVTAREAHIKLTSENPALNDRSVRIFRFLPEQAVARKLPAAGIYASLQTGAQGDLLVESKKYAAALLERAATGDFTHPNGRSAALVLLIDANADSNFGANERFPIDKSFKLGDGWYQVDTVQSDGTEFKLKKAPSPEEIAKRSAPPTVGDTAAAFSGPGLDGKPVNFPADYKGKLVLVDFWATWCGPCVAELPNVKAIYDKYHDKGLDVLGISFDKPGQAENVRKFAEARKLPWRQIYEGKFWSTEIGLKWNINSIPAAYLIDADTGRIVAAGPALRGPYLDATIGLELKNKFREIAP